MHVPEPHVNNYKISASDGQSEGVGASDDAAGASDEVADLWGLGCLCAKAMPTKARMRTKERMKTDVVGNEYSRFILFKI